MIIKTPKAIPLRILIDDNRPVRKTRYYTKKRKYYEPNQDRERPNLNEDVWGWYFEMREKACP